MGDLGCPLNSLFIRGLLSKRAPKFCLAVKAILDVIGSRSTVNLSLPFLAKCRFVRWGRAVGLFIIGGDKSVFPPLTVFITPIRMVHDRPLSPSTMPK